MIPDTTSGGELTQYLGLEHNTEAFAGLLHERKRIIVVFDEASNIADLVWEVAECTNGRRH